jgi:hypothetical protein
VATGRRPFAGRSSAELASSILRDTPRPASDIRRDLPRDLALILTRWPEKSPENRFPTAVAVRDHLQRLGTSAELATVGVPHPAARRRPFVGRDAEWAERHLPREPRPRDNPGSRT